MTNILPRNTKLKKESLQSLIVILANAQPLLKAQIYNELMYRIESSSEVVEILLNAMIDKNNRRNSFWGFIKVAWIPIIGILDTENKNLIAKAKKILVENWNIAERKNLYEYLKNDFELSDIL